MGLSSSSGEERREKLLMFPSVLLSLLHDILFNLRADAEVIDFITFLAFPGLFPHFHPATKKHIGLSPYYFEHKHVALCSLLESCFDKLSPARQRN